MTITVNSWITSVDRMTGPSGAEYRIIGTDIVDLSIGHSSESSSDEVSKALCGIEGKSNNLLSIRVASLTVRVSSW